MPIEKDALRSCLMRKFGFEEVEGSKHEAVALFIEGRKIATTRFSRSHRNISDKILGLIAREIWVQSGYFRQMYSCTKDPDDYLRHLQETGHIR